MWPKLFVGAGVVRGYDSVQFVTQNADLQFPERIRGTNMRRLMATLCQVNLVFILFNMQLNETPYLNQVLCK